MNKTMLGIMFGIVLMFVIGCSTPQSCIVATNNTGIGIVASYNPQTQMPDAKLGYVNSAFTIVPTNRAWSKDVAVSGEGAKDTGNVLIETSFTNWFKFWSDQSIYQRVAVGNDAVKQPGAVAMFAKSADGSVNVEAVKALAGLQTYTSNPALLTAKNALIALYNLATPEQKAKVVAALQKISLTWDQFIDSTTVTVPQVQAVIDGAK